MYYAKMLDKIDNGKGYWDGQLIGVFLGSRQIGEFQRNYSSFGVETFAPFRRGSDWYALYSRKYTALSVMKLHEDSIEHIGGEAEDDSGGFCPVETYIPRFNWEFTPGSTPEELKKYPVENHRWISRDRYDKVYDTDECFEETEFEYEDFAFVSGCHWGDDSSWKIDYRDISKAHEGIITRPESWGYYEMARGKYDLKDVLHLSSFQQFSKTEKTTLNITMNIQKTVRFQENGELREF